MIQDVTIVEVKSDMKLIDLIGHFSIDVPGYSKNPPIET